MTPRAEGRPRSPRRSGFLSAMLPGLGQLVQGRWLSGLLHLLTFLAYLGTAVGTSLTVAGTRAAWFAILWNVWSSIEAFVYQWRRNEEDND